MPANALESAGTTATMCQACREYVCVATNERGRVIDIYIDEEDEHERPRHHGAVHYDHEDEEEEEEYEYEGGHSYARRGGIYIPLFLLLLGLLFLGWIASTMYCRPARPQAPIVPSPTLEPEVESPTPVPAPTRPPVITLDSDTGVTFDTGKATLTQQSQQALLDLAETLKGAPKTAVFEIRGYTDNQGDEASNKELSKQRAETVRKFLIEKGVTAQLQTKGLGAAAPKESNETEAGRRRNRRIEVAEIKTVPPKPKPTAGN